MLNRYGERTLPCRVPRVTQNGSLYEPFYASYTIATTHVQVKHELTLETVTRDI